MENKETEREESAMKIEPAIYDEARRRVGDPPAAEAYCRMLAFEVEHLARKAERELIIHAICEDCREGIPFDKDFFHKRKDIFGKDVWFDCKAEAVLRISP